MERAHAMMLAMLAREPFWPTGGMPHSGLIPTGAVEGLAEGPVRTAESLLCCNCERG